ncbi:recombinase family protein [Streptomyces reniochalinae]|uniref:recombinase family protein n=1 Tax=Streptomyces reniochalinae TaxID=2250578 RepID=UPI00248304BF|nr:recombinase family protein [Streptomyces reniochalinae]
MPATFRAPRTATTAPTPLPPGWETAHRFIYPPASGPAANWPRAVIYARQSKLNEDGSNASPQMQKTAGEGLCQARQYNPVACFTDAGSSGWDPRTIREGFNELMEWVRARKCDVVVIFALSRLTRQGALDALEIEAEMRKHGVTLVSVQEPYLDTSDAIGIGIFAIIAGLAKQESDNKSAFILNSRDLARQAGGHLSGPPPFGMRSTKAKTPDGVAWVKLVPEDEFGYREWTEADTVRRMVDMAIGDPARDVAGKTTGQIAEWLNAEGVPAPSLRATHKGRKYSGLKHQDVEAAPPHWSITQVHRVLRDPRIAGIAADKTGSYTFEMRRDEAGNPMHVHKGIITPAKWYVLQEALGASARRTKRRGGAAMTLVTGWGFAECECEAHMTYTGEAKDSYRCSRSATARKVMGTGHRANSIKASEVDAYVTERVFARMLNLDHEDADDLTLMREVARRFAAQTDTSATANELAEYKAQLKHTEQSLKDLYEERGLYKGKDGKTAWRNAVSTMLATQARCHDEIERLEAEQTERIVLPIDEWYAAESNDPTGPGSPWSTWGIIKRREFLALWLDGITVTQPEDARTRLPVEERVTLRWAQPATEDEADDEADEELTAEAARAVAETV